MYLLVSTLCIIYYIVKLLFFFSSFFLLFFLKGNLTKKRKAKKKKKKKEKNIRGQPAWKSTKSAKYRPLPVSFGSGCFNVYTKSLLFRFICFSPSACSHVGLLFGNEEQRFGWFMMYLTLLLHIPALFMTSLTQRVHDVFIILATHSSLVHDVTDTKGSWCIWHSCYTFQPCLWSLTQSAAGLKMAALMAESVGLSKEDF